MGGTGKPWHGSKRNSRRLIGLQVKERGAKLLARSVETKQLVREKKGLFLKTYGLIEKNFEDFRNGAEFNDKEGGLHIKKANTGSRKGSHNQMTLKVSAQGREFFIKIFELKDYLNVLKGIRTVEDYLRRRNYKIENVTIRVIKPHLLYENRATGRGYLVTDFFNESEVILVHDMPKKSEERKRIINAIEVLRKPLEYKHDVIEIQPFNAFYCQKTDTVLLFDLQHFNANQ